MSYGRISDLNGLPELIVQKAGEDALRWVLDQQSIPFELLEEPDAIILMKDMLALYRSAGEVTGLRSFGLEAGQGLDISDYGAMGNFVLQAPSLKDAFLRFQRALPFYESGSRLTLQETGAEFIVGYENIYQNLVGFRNMGDMTLRIIEGTVRGYLGNDWRPNRVATCGKKGRWEQDYEDAFIAPTAFREDRLALVLDRGLVEENAAHGLIGPGELVSFADIKRMGQKLPDDFVASVAMIIEMNLTDQRATLEQTAKKLALGPRTLQRRLGEYGFNYRQLVDRCRMSRACDLLSGSAANVEDISREVGYSCTPHFTRAFSRVHDITPSEFRMTHQHKLSAA